MALLPNIETEYLLVDKAYDAQERVLDKLQAQGCEAIILSKSNRNKPRDLLLTQNI